MNKKVFRKLKTAISVTLLVLSFVVLGLSIIARVSSDIPQVFGYSFHIVITDSMSPEILPEDLVIAKKTDISKIEIGDDVVFVSADPSLNGKVIIHRVLDINEDGSLVTGGIKQGATADRYPVNEIIGKYSGKSRAFGRVLSFFLRPENLIFMVIVVVLFYATYRLAFKMYKIVKSSDDSVEDDVASHQIQTPDTSQPNAAKQIAKSTIVQTPEAIETTEATQEKTEEEKQ